MSGRETMNVDRSVLHAPIGIAGNGLPLGMQLAARTGEDNRLLAVAAWCEARLPFKGLV
jgi:Asp-tRNA(Asn)/Glu-tRNA(Gln) amidotransferase A subunit family amidase